MKFSSASITLAALSILPSVIHAAIQPISIKVFVAPALPLTFRGQNSFMKMEQNSTLLALHINQPLVTAPMKTVQEDSSTLLAIQLDVDETFPSCKS